MLSCAQNQIALSRMGKQVSRVRLSGKEIIVGVRAYLDRSGQRKASFVTLAAFAAPDITWRYFEEGWYEILEDAFRPVPYFHMIEALGLRQQSPFDRNLGWERKHVWELVFKLAQYMSNFGRGSLTMHSCVIDMNAWRELVAQGCDIPSEIYLCNQYVSHYIVKMFARKVMEAAGEMEEFSIPVEDLLSFSFDRNEDFFDAFRVFVNKEKQISRERGIGGMWDLVDGVGEADMIHSPGIQAADILAWGINRENTASAASDGKHLAHILRQIVMSTRKEYDRQTLLREFGSQRPNTRL